MREDIQNAAWKLFADKGFAAVTTDEIALAAGVSPSTYYRHVATKDDLLIRPIGASSAEIARRFGEQLSSVSVVGGLATVIVERTREADTDELNRWRAALAGAPELIERITLIGEVERRRLIEIATDRVDATGDRTLRAGALVSAVLGAAEYAYRRWLDDDAAAGLIEVITEVMNALTDQ